MVDRADYNSLARSDIEKGCSLARGDRLAGRPTHSSKCSPVVVGKRHVVDPVFRRGQRQGVCRRDNNRVNLTRRGSSRLSHNRPLEKGIGELEVNRYYLLEVGTASLGKGPCETTALSESIVDVFLLLCDKNIYLTATRRRSGRGLSWSRLRRVSSQPALPSFFLWTTFRTSSRHTRHRGHRRQRPACTIARQGAMPCI